MVGRDERRTVDLDRRKLLQTHEEAQKKVRELERQKAAAVKDWDAKIRDANKER